MVEADASRPSCRLSELAARHGAPRGEGLLAPGFIDVQVNGGGGVLFNDARTVEGIRAIGAAHRRFGTTGFLPTFITDTREKMAEAIEAVRDGLAAGVPACSASISKGRSSIPSARACIDPKFMRPIEEEDIRIMTSLGAGRTLVTLAPEMVPPEVDRAAGEAGVDRRGRPHQGRSTRRFRRRGGAA